jgi:hypothetical protein
MADDDIVRSAEDHLRRVVERTDEERTIPGRRITVEDVPNPYVAVRGEDVYNGDDLCHVCECVAVAPDVDGWETGLQPGPEQDTSRELIGSIVLCTPCKELWERGDYDELYERCVNSVWVDDLAQLAGDTIRIEDPRHDPGDDFGYAW